MAYGGYLPQNYYQNIQPYYSMPQAAQNNTQNVAATSSGGIIWVQGEAAAKAFPVGAGQSVQLMDSEDSLFYIKSTDQSGMPQPLRIFEYKERSSGHSEPAVVKNPAGDYVSRKEFETFQTDVRNALKNVRKPEKEEGEG